MEFYITVKRKKLELHESIWINSTNTILIERKQFVNEYLQYDIYMQQFYKLNRDIYVERNKEMQISEKLLRSGQRLLLGKEDSYRVL